MPINPFTNFLIKLSEKKKSLSYKFFSLLGGIIFFLILLPTLFIYFGKIVETHIYIKWPILMRRIIIYFHIPFGLLILSWAAFTQWIIGKGTPVPNAPTQKLVIKGPYKLCRNPIELGSILYYLGIGTLIATITTGFVCLISGFILISIYQKLIEEKELEIRFGEEYIQYKKNTPFIFPKIWRLF